MRSKNFVSQMKQKLLHIQSLLAVMLCVLLSATLTACSDDDDDEPNGSLVGTSWTVTAADDDEDIIGVSITFQKDGNVKFTPSNDWTYAKWEQNGKTLKITLGEDEPDDYIMGDFVISGSSAVFTYSWYDIDGTFHNGPHTMKLQKK